MKTKLLSILTVLGMIFGMTAQTITTKDDGLQYNRPAGKEGVNVFETSKDDNTEFDGLKVKVGADFALQFQGLRADNANLGNNFNLPTANLNIDAQLADGMRVHLRTYLSSRHHNETWVKGGYLQIDKLDFVSPGFAEEIMKITTLKFGMDDINYGDAHFRRTDNAQAIYNPFVGNYIMDSFTTEAFAEVTLQPNDLLFVAGISNGNLNQTAKVTASDDASVRLYTKVGIDKQVSEDLRTRLTGSYTIAPGSANGGYLYGGDRAGSRYYLTDNFRDGRVNPGFTDMQAWVINPFIKYRGLEFFGIFEQTYGYAGDTSETNDPGKYTQIAGELLYRFGTNEKFYVGGRYNSVTGYGDYSSTATAQSGGTDRFNVGGGWFMTDNVLTKLEYVSQSYDGTGSWDDPSQNFQGFVLEAVISF
ncbi:hypothetical protein N9L20_00560 [Flavobacteriaceae bacterium]|nr:hypothetical protein [Flavobacteriaceae bacterium]